LRLSYHHLNKVVTERASKPVDDQSPTGFTCNSPHFSDRVIGWALSLRNLRIYESEDNIMQYPKLAVARRSLKPLIAVLLATSLGGCVGYTGYPSGDYGYSQPNYRYSQPNYGYSSYPSSYYVGFPSTYGNSYSQRPYYPPSYSR
jgi:hypothetical protein